MTDWSPWTVNVLVKNLPSSDDIENRSVEFFWIQPFNSPNIAQALKKHPTNIAVQSIKNVMRETSDCLIMKEGRRFKRLSVHKMRKAIMVQPLILVVWLSTFGLLENALAALFIFFRSNWKKINYSIFPLFFSKNTLFIRRSKQAFVRYIKCNSEEKYDTK